MVPETSSTTDRIFCHFGQFLAHLPPKNPKNENFKKMEKLPGDVTILHKCTKNYDHMVYCSWDMACEMYWLFFTLGYFLPFCLVTCSKNENFKKIKKNTWRYHILHKCTKNHDHMQYFSWDMARDGCNCYFSFWAIFCPFTAQKIKISKKWSTWRYHHFTHVYQKLWLDDVRFLRNGARQTDGRTEKVTHRDGCPT